jgi:arsenate reductase (thioredoxin)
MINILVLCTGNSCRSQIAHGYLAHFTDAAKVTVYSAGVETHGVNPKAIATMKVDGMDISQHTSNHVNEYLGIDFNYVITVCDNAAERCPVFAKQTRLIKHNFKDPAKATGTNEEIENEFARVRDEIKSFCKEFVQSI